MNFKPLVILGSGVSRPTFGDEGMVNGLTEGLFQDRWVLTTAETWEPDREYNAALIQPQVQEFLRRLRGHVEDYYVENRGSRPNYEDLYGLAHQVADEEGWRDNAAVAAFRLEGRSLCADLLPPRRSFEHKPLYDLASRSLDFIQSFLASKLLHRGTIQGLELLAQLVDRGSQPVTICTLNHDLLVEEYLADRRIVDGFSPIPIHGVRYFDQREFAAVVCDVKLLKLHGSINWRVLPNDDVGIFVGLVEERKNRDGGRIDARKAQPRILTGDANKLLDYQTGIFLIQLTEFDRALEEHDLIVMSGYGWGDQGISRRLRSWALAKPDRRILLMHQDPESLRPARPLQHSFDRLVEGGRLVFIKKWMKDVSIDEVQETLSGRTIPPN